MGILDSLKKLFGGPGQDQPADNSAYPGPAADPAAPADPASAAQGAGQENEDERVQ